MEKDVLQKIEDFEVKHKIVSFVIILVATIVIIRLLTSIVDPNFFVKGLELHHFHYGLILLIVTTLLLLYRRINFKVGLVLSAISIGLILDELVFISGKMRGPIEYGATTLPTIISAIVLILTVELIFYLHRKKRK